MDICKYIPTYSLDDERRAHQADQYILFSCIFANTFFRRRRTFGKLVVVVTSEVLESFTIRRTLLNKPIL